jgi:hypothetical protein
MIYLVQKSGGPDCVGTLSSLILRTHIVIPKYVLFEMLEVRPTPENVNTYIHTSFICRLMLGIKDLAFYCVQNCFC